MSRDEFKEISARQTALEAEETARNLPPGSPVLARLSLVNFRLLNQRLNRPYDERFAHVMAETACYLLARTQATVAFQHGDEISLLFPNEVQGVPLIFGGRTQKLCSTLASACTAKFAQQMGVSLPAQAEWLQTFDAKVWSVPSREDATMYFDWRQMMALRVSAQALGALHFSPEELAGKSPVRGMRKLELKGVDLTQYPKSFFQGQFFRKSAKPKEAMTAGSGAGAAPATELSGQAQTQMNARVSRSSSKSKGLHALDMPPLPFLGNAVDVFFEDAEPLLRA